MDCPQLLHLLGARVCGTWRMARCRLVSRVRGASPRGERTIWRVTTGGRGCQARYGVHHGGRGSSSTVGEREKRAVVCVQSVQSEAIVTITHQASQPIFPPLRGLFNGFNDLWVQRRFSQMGRAGVHRPSYPILSAQVRQARQDEHPKRKLV